MVIFNSYVSLPEGMANVWDMSKEFLFLSCLFDKFDKTTLSLTFPKRSNCIPHDTHFINVNLPLTAMNELHAANEAVVPMVSPWYFRE